MAVQKLSDLKSYTVLGADLSVPASAPQRPKGLLQQATDTANSMFPGKQTGEAIGTLVAYALAPKEQKEFVDLDAPQPQEVLGDVAAGAATVAGFKGVGSTGGLVRKALESAGLGAVMGGGRAAAEGGDVEDVALASAGGAAIGAGTSAAFSGVEALLKGFRALPERLIRSATGQSKAELIAGKDISKYVLENKRVGTADQIIRSAQTAMDEADKFINESLDSVTDKTIPLKDIITDITSSINSAGGDIDEVGVRSVLESLAPQVKRTLGAETLTLAQANRLRSQLDKLLGNRAFIASQLPFNKGILMDVTNALREQVKGNAPEGVREAFSTLSNEKRLRDLLIAKTAQGSRNQIIGLGDLLSGGLGSVALGGVPGALGGALAKRATESTLGKTAGAALIDRLDQSLTPVLSGLAPAAQTAILNALIAALSDGEG